MKKCPYCAEEIQDEAIFCRYCGRDVRVAPAPVEPVTPEPDQPTPQREPGGCMRIAAILIVMTVAIIIVASIASSLAPKAPAYTPPNISSFSQWHGTLVCDECASVGMEISIWKAPDSNRVLAFTAPNNTPVTVVDSRCAGGTCYYQVDTPTGTGWVNQAYVKK